MKFFILAILLATPSWMLWKLPDSSTGNRSATGSEFTHAVSSATVKVPVEVIEKGSLPKWQYVEVKHSMVPEPDSMLLVLLAGALSMLRHRRN